MSKRPFAGYLCFESAKDRVGPRNDKDRVILDPTWSQVEEAIQRLDGCDRSYVMLAASRESAGEALLTVGGGKDGRYVCFVYDGDEHNLVDPRCTDESTVEVFIGQLSVRQRREFVELAPVLRAARAYWESGERDVSLSWVMQRL